MYFEQHTKQRQLTSNELTEAKSSVVENLQEIERIEAAFNIVRADFKKELKPHKNLIKELIKKITTGLDVDSAYCKVVVDPITQTVKFFKVKRNKDEDDGMQLEDEVLFDELPFAEVGETQLSMWQQEAAASADDPVHGDIPEPGSTLDERELKLFNNCILLFNTINGTRLQPDDVVKKFVAPLDGHTASMYIMQTRTPYSAVNVAASTQGLHAAISEVEKHCMQQFNLQSVASMLFDGLFADHVEVLSAELMQWLIAKKSGLLAGINTTTANN